MRAQPGGASLPFRSLRIFPRLAAAALAWLLGYAAPYSARGDGVSVGLSLVAPDREIPDLLPSLRDLLTPREFQIAGCVRDGLENREIAKDLKMSYHSVKTYVSRACERVGCDNRVMLAVRYQREEMQGRYESR